MHPSTICSAAPLKSRRGSSDPPCAAQLSIERLRLQAWGNVLGLPATPASTSPAARHYQQLGSDEVKPVVEKVLLSLIQRLQKADLITERYELKDNEETGPPEASAPHSTASSTGLTIFRLRYEAFKAKIRRNQSAASLWKVTRWAVHDLAKFRGIIEDIRALLDGLDKVAAILGTLDQQHAVLVEAVQDISDGGALRLVDLASHNGDSPSLIAISETASIRLSQIADTLSGAGSRSLETQTFCTAPSRPRALPLADDLPDASEQRSLLQGMTPFEACKEEWVRVFEESPSTSFLMMKSILETLEVTVEQFLQNPAVLKDSNRDRLRQKAHHPHLVETGDSIAATVASRLMDRYSGVFQFSLSGAGIRQVALCSNTGVFIDSDQSDKIWLDSGPLIFPVETDLYHPPGSGDSAGASDVEEPNAVAAQEIWRRVAGGVCSMTLGEGAVASLDRLVQKPRLRCAFR